MPTVTFTSSGTFTVPDYGTLTVEVFGKKGADAGAYSGGLGGRALRSYTAGDVGSPTPGAVISVTVNPTASVAYYQQGLAQFSFGTNPYADGGDIAVDDVAGYEYTSGGDTYYQDPIPGHNGAAGHATGGTTNAADSTETAPKVVVTYTVPAPAIHMDAAGTSTGTATASLRTAQHFAGSAVATQTASADLQVTTPGFNHLAASATARAFGAASLRVQPAPPSNALIIGGVEAVTRNIEYLASYTSVGMANMSIAIANTALDLLEEEPITAATDNRTPVRWMIRNFSAIRDALLRSHPWNFAVRRVTLTRLDLTPSYGWASGYALPPDCLRILPLTGDYENGADIPYTVEGQTILANGTSPMRLRYISRVVDDTKMDPIFQQALAATVAARAANFMTGKQSYAKYCQEMAERLTLQAQMVDALEGSPYQSQGDDWLNGRSGVVYGNGGGYY